MMAAPAGVERSLSSPSPCRRVAVSSLVGASDAGGMLGRMTTTVRVLLESGRTKTFASALDWPGWCRCGKGDEGALDALEGYADRYRAVARGAGARFPAHLGLEIVDRVPGDATTDFGAPSVASTLEAGPLTPADLARQVSLLRAAWDALDELAVSAPEQLRKGPRGGGRDRDGVVDHVAEAERAYARKIGVRHPPFAAPGDVAVMRESIATALLAGEAEGAWSPAYFLRRSAWHVLDHVWEIEDKST